MRLIARLFAPFRPHGHTPDRPMVMRLFARVTASLVSEERRSRTVSLLPRCFVGVGMVSFTPNRPTPILSRC
jgi:hypothetical protein